MSQAIENTQVQNIVHFKAKYKELVQNIVLARNTAGITQEFVSEWLGVDRRKIISFEKLKKIDLEILLLYSHKMSIDVKLSFEIN